MPEKSTFEKVTQSPKILYGPRKFLLCGFGAESQKKFETVLGLVSLTDVPRVWVTTEQGAASLAELLDLAGDSGSGAPSTLPRAVIVAGITEAQLISLMTVCKKSGMQQPLWAVLTPVSEKWTVEQLLAELAREREALQKKK
jgi:hypothetical protein